MLGGSVVPFVNQTVGTCCYHLEAISRTRSNVTHEACTAAVRPLVLRRLDDANSLLISAPVVALLTEIAGSVEQPSK